MLKREVMKNYLEAVNNKEYEKISQIIYFNNDPEDSMMMHLGAIEDEELISYKIRSIENEDNDRYIVNYFSNKTPVELYGEEECTAYIVRIDGNWRVVLNKNQLPD